MELFNAIKISKYIYLPKTESTNQYAQTLVSKSNPVDHYCIYTDNQTQGRGQIGRFWFSDQAKNLTTSFLIHLKYPASRQFNLNMIFGLAVLFMVKEMIPTKKVTIKWPNDIYIENNKLAGILIQNIIRGTNITHGIFGVGLNINQLEFPANIPNPVSLKQITGEDYDQLKTLYILQQHLEEKMDYFLNNTEELKAAYIFNMYGIGQKLKFLDEGKTPFEGWLEGVTKEGKLLLKTENEIRAYNFREISFIIPG